MLTVTQSCILFFYPPQILIILEEVEQLALGGVVRSTHNTTGVLAAEKVRPCP
jgi:hypothetical protein